VVRLSVIIVNWNTRELLERCLCSVYRTETALQAEVIVVDNASGDGSVEMVASRYPEAILIANPENRGFARANNQAMERATGDYLLLLNPDTEVLGHALSEMIEYADQHPEVAVVGPHLLNPDGSVQSSRRRFPTPATAFLESTVLQRWVPNHAALRRYYLLDRSDSEVQEVDWLVGACLLVRADAARQVGPMDEGYFMYSEELDWCKRFAAKGWKLVYTPTAQVVHFGGQSSDQDVYGRHIQFQYSKGRYFEKYHGSFFAQLLRLFILGNYLFLLGEDLLKLVLSPRKRSMRRQRIRTLRQVIGWLIRWVASMGRVSP